MCVYLICLDRPYEHARHYVGWAKNVEKRVAHHTAGTGSRFMQVIGAAGIGWIVAKVWEGADRTFERKLKDTHSVADYCPRCRGEKARRYQPKITNRQRNVTHIAAANTDLLKGH